MKGISLKISALIVLAIIFLPVTVKAGFGVSPGSIKESKLVPGISLEKTIYLVQGNPTEDLTIHSSIESPDIKDWIMLKNGTDFVIPAGVQQYPLQVQINIPKGAELGIYKAFIQVNTVPKKVEDSQITIALGGKIDVELNVGDDLVSEFSIKSIDIFDVKENSDPRIAVTVTNSGNVPAAPQSASFELFNKYGNIRLAYAESESFKKVPAFEESTSIITFPLDVKLGVGEYWGHVKIYSDGKVIRELKTVFNVYPQTFIEKNKLSIGVVIAVLLIGAVLVWRKRKQVR